MLITHFNKMIRNKFIWGAVAFIVSISFVLSYSAITQGCNRTSPDAVAEIFGDEVNYAEFQQALFFEQGMERQRATTDVEREQLEASAWKRIAVLKLAKRMDLVTPMHEVGALIRRSPSFAVDGRHDNDQYTRLVANRFGVRTSTFERFQQENLTIEKLYNSMRSMVWTSPFEVNAKVRDLTDQFKVEYGFFDADTFTPETALEDDDYLSYYSANTNLFREPKRVSVHYVTFPFESFSATNAIDEELITIYYDEHLDDYKIPDSTNILDEYRPIADVRDDIIATLRETTRADAARFAAEEFVISLLPDRRTTPPTLEEAVAANEALSTQTTEPFTQYDEIPGIKVDYSFNSAAFNLTPDDPTTKYSDAVMGEDAAYILAFNSARESYIPTFEDVKDAVMPLAQQDAERDAFEDNINGIAEAARDGMTTNDTLASTLAEHKLEFVTTDYFTVYSSMVSNDVAYSEELSTVAVDLAPGQVSEAIFVAEGAVVAKLLDRKPGPSEETFAFTPQVQRTLEQYRAAQLFDAWRDYVLDLAEYKDLRRPIDDSSSL